MVWRVGGGRRLWILHLRRCHLRMSTVHRSHFRERLLPSRTGVGVKHCGQQHFVRLPPTAAGSSRPETATTATDTHWALTVPEAQCRTHNGLMHWPARRDFLCLMQHVRPIGCTPRYLDSTFPDRARPTSRVRQPPN